MFCFSTERIKRKEEVKHKVELSVLYVLPENENERLDVFISQNIDVAVVAARLGHAQITTTLNFYVHPVVSHNKVAGNTLQNLLISQKND